MLLYGLGRLAKDCANDDHISYYTTQFFRDGARQKARVHNQRPLPQLSVLDSKFHDSKNRRRKRVCEAHKS